ncbi:flagellar filament capping protein FliD [Anaerobacillus isosaccharinicus]|uniref:Flagellar hook-associated protein 2 n=1 Tax=Anaerobacillus isosaccharinicus TaxID=1532552 RepID=A0A1S2L9E5_9BACI|nr:flagellar filament capping protein FliD [Anaerobacillus isosaccharinicus]MBA5584613.1 flagellar filament capping protein FliD [Anaerobacillus isosaccharinicus]QOY37008.1 flagellar filament capping protein FliD [Anaerobacillus isosaccharinicus]
MRIGGIASGLDTETIIRDLMKIERLPLDRFFQRKQTLEWQRDAYRDMNLQLKNLHDAASNIRLRSSLNTRVATVTDTQILTATANASVKTGTYEINVISVAKTEKYMSDSQIVTDTAEKINVSTAFNSQISVTDNEFSINGQNFTIDDKSLNDILKEINKREGLGVRASYDSVFDRVVIETINTGINKTDGSPEIVLGGGFFSKVNIDVNNPFQQAANAEFTYKDMATGLTTEPIVSKENRNTVGGITVNLQAVGTSTITVTSNTDDAFNKIKSFVDKYNEIIGLVQTKVSEKVNRGFRPLTDEQRRELSEREAELWDEKAKSGLLSRDQTLTSALNRMRLDLYSPVSNSGQFNQLAQIGITTTSNFREGGKLEIDETKLRAALADDPDAVHQLFNGTAVTGATETETYNQTGLIGRLRTTIDDTIKKIESRAGNQFRTNQQFTLGRELTNIDQQIDRFQRRLSDIENRHWAKFTAMEKAMNQANAQGMAFMNQIMGAGNF